MMINKLSTISLHLGSWLLAVCFTASLFICGDADCSSSDNDKDCTCLLCVLLHNHGASLPDSFSGNNKDCSCVCHVPTIIGPIFNFSYHPTAQYNTAVVILQIFPVPNRLVYHPPATV